MTVRETVMLEEYKLLRQEHEGNRKFVFERPLLIVGGTLAVAGSFSKQGSLLVLTFPFLFVLFCNLWLTFNRLQSSTRIVAYIQLVHEGNSPLPWVGWENALRAYRVWRYDVQIERRSAPSRIGIQQTDSMRFYRNIFIFHLGLGVVLTAVLVAASVPPSSGVELALIGISVFSLIIFGFLHLRLRPGKINDSIEWERRVWSEVLSVQTESLDQASAAGI